MSDRQTALSNVALSKEIGKRLGIKPKVAQNVIETYGLLCAEALADKQSIRVPEVGTIKPCTLAAREYHNPRGGNDVQKPVRPSARLELGKALKERLGR